MANTRTQQEIEQLIAGYERSGLSRRQYCEQLKIPLRTFDYYRRRHGKQDPPSGQLVKVELEESLPDKHEAKGFTLVLSKGRRIEMNWNYAEQHLARLIRIVEAA